MADVRGLQASIEAENETKLWHHRRSAVFNALERIGILLDEGEYDEAKEELEALSGALDKWL